jgi:hypothetical protein
MKQITRRGEIVPIPGLANLCMPMFQPHNRENHNAIRIPFIKLRPF